MKAVQENPYRVLGIWAGATEREILRKQSRLKAYIDVKKEIDLETDLDLLNELPRTSKKIQSAISAIEKTAGRIEHSLFWFSNFTPIDKLALDHLVSGNLKKSLDIWSKPIEQTTNDLRKISAINNLGTLKFLLSLNKGGEAGRYLFLDGFRLKCSLFEIESISLYAEAFRDSTFKTNDKTVERLAKKFFSRIKQLIKSDSILSSEDVESLMSNQNGIVRALIEKTFAEESISAIESNVQQAKNSRLDEPATANVVGKHLFARSFEHVKYLEKILGNSSTKYQMLSDKVAGELLECSISYYNHHAEYHKVDPGDDALLLINKAKQFANGPSVKKRIKKNLPVIKEWVDSKKEREKRRLVADELNYIEDQLSKKANSRSVSDANELITKCKPKLAIIRDKIGENASLYINISSSVVTVASNIAVDNVNVLLKKLNQSSNVYPYANYVNPEEISSVISSAFDVFMAMEYMCMSSTTKKSYRENREVITGLNRELNEQKRAARKANSGGCYIATMAYGSYDHPQVLKLRAFRDFKLAKSKPGRTFIKMYYYISPTLVNTLGEFELVHRISRKCLNSFIQLISKQ